MYSTVCQLMTHLENKKKPRFQISAQIILILVPLVLRYYLVNIFQWPDRAETPFQLSVPIFGKQNQDACHVCGKKVGQER